MRPTRTALRAALDPATRHLLRAAEAAARDLDVGLWLVGGGVRDLAAGRPLYDLDLAFSGGTHAFVDALAGRVHGHDVDVERTDRFGTATVTVDGARLDLARLRRERYVVPGALPEVRATRRIEVDLARRDFTVNAMALGLVGPDAGAVIDPYRGLQDLAARRLRVLHERSFVDDATRLWRGARTAALFDLAPDATTARLIEEGARWIEEISGERLWTEFARTAARGHVLGTFERLDRWGVLRAVHPRLRLHEAARAALRRRRTMPATRLAAVLLAPLPAREAVLDRFRVPREVRDVVRDTARLLDAPASCGPDTLSALEGTHPEARTAALWLDPEPQRRLQPALRRWERTRPPLTADDLARLGVGRGPQLGAALHGLRRGRFLGTLRTPADARRHVRRALAGEVEWDPWQRPQSPATQQPRQHPREPSGGRDDARP